MNFGLDYLTYIMRTNIKDFPFSNIIGSCTACIYVRLAKERNCTGSEQKSIQVFLLNLKCSWMNSQSPSIKQHDTPTTISTSLTR